MRCGDGEYFIHNNQWVKLWDKNLMTGLTVELFYVVFMWIFKRLEREKKKKVVCIYFFLSSIKIRVWSGENVDLYLHLLCFYSVDDKRKEKKWIFNAPSWLFRVISFWWRNIDALDAIWFLQCAGSAFYSLQFAALELKVRFFFFNSKYLIENGMPAYINLFLHVRNRSRRKLFSIIITVS